MKKYILLFSLSLVVGTIRLQARNTQIMAPVKRLAFVNNTPGDVECIFYWGNCRTPTIPPVSLLLSKGERRLLEYRDCVLNGFLIQTADRKRMFMTDDAPACEAAGVYGYVLSGKRNFINCWFSKGTGEITIRMPRVKHWFSSEQDMLPVYLRDTGSNLVVDWEID
jgi:hypothetical protein